MPLSATTPVNPGTSVITVKIGPKKDTANKSFTSVWQGLQEMGYSEQEIYKIEKQLEKTTVNGKKYNARKIADGTTVDVTDAIKKAGVKMPAFGKLTGTETPAQKSEQVNTKEYNSGLTYKNRPVNAEPVLVSAENAINKYGGNKITSLASEMTAINEADGSYLKTTHGKNQPWCADGVNYFYQQLLGVNPFTNSNKKNLSCVSQLQGWAQNKGIFSKAYSPEEISAQMQNIKLGDMIIFKRPRMVLTTDGKYHPVSTSHAAVVVGVKDGKILLMESNSNLYETDEQGRFYREKDNTIRLSTAQSDSVMLKEYGPNELFSRGYTGYADMQEYLK